MPMQLVHHLILILLACLTAPCYAHSPCGEPTHSPPGDVNGDGVADFFDAQAMVALISGGAVAIDVEDYQADPDVNRDGVIDVCDAQIALADVTKDPGGGMPTPSSVRAWLGSPTDPCSISSTISLAQ